MRLAIEVNTRSWIQLCWLLYKKSKSLGQKADLWWVWNMILI